MVLIHLLTRCARDEVHRHKKDERCAGKDIAHPEVGWEYSGLPVLYYHHPKVPCGIRVCHHIEEHHKPGCEIEPPLHVTVAPLLEPAPPEINPAHYIKERHRDNRPPEEKPGVKPRAYVSDMCLSMRTRGWVARPVKKVFSASEVDYEK